MYILNALIYLLFCVNQVTRHILHPLQSSIDLSKRKFSRDALFESLQPHALDQTSFEKQFAGLVQWG